MDLNTYRVGEGAATHAPVQLSDAETLLVRLLEWGASELTAVSREQSVPKVTSLLQTRKKFNYDKGLRIRHH